MYNASLTNQEEVFCNAVAGEVLVPQDALKVILKKQMDEYHKYLNTETGEIITVSSEDLGIAEESDENDDF